MIEVTKRKKWVWACDKIIRYLITRAMKFWNDGHKCCIGVIIWIFFFFFSKIGYSLRNEKIERNVLAKEIK